MLFSAVRFLTLVLVLSSLAAAAGCGGNEGYGCAAVIDVSPVKADAGSYTATFTPTGATAPTENLLLGSEAGNLRNGCSIEGSLIQLSIATSATTTDFLRATREGRNSLVGTYGATLGLTAATTGTLVVANAASG